MEKHTLAKSPVFSCENFLTNVKFTGENLRRENKHVTSGQLCAYISHVNLEHFHGNKQKLIDIHM